jgi:CRISPR-associated protein Csd1
VILQALHEFYQRQEFPEPEGLEYVEFPFILVIDNEGHLLDIEDTREDRGGEKRQKAFLVPKSRQRSGSKAYASPNFLWDHIGYVLGFAKSGEPKDIELACKQHESWLKNVSRIAKDLKDIPGVRSIEEFYEREQIQNVFKHELWKECRKIPGCKITFRLSGDSLPVPCYKEVHEYVQSLQKRKNLQENDTQKIGVCLITGEKGIIARKHTKTPISKDSKALVGFQRNSGYDSYGKEQGYNAPVSVKAEEAYTKALNQLLQRDSPNKFILADTTIIFWAQKKESQIYDFEQDFPWFFREPPEDDTQKGVFSVRSLYEAARTGKLPSNNEGRFYVLGLAPSSARIAVRFWRSGTIRQFGENILAHFDSFSIVKDFTYRKEGGLLNKEYLSLQQIMGAIVPKGDFSKLPPKIIGSTMMSVLDGTQYPRTLLQQCMLRVRAEREINRARAAILKACLNRFGKVNGNKGKEVLGVALDRNNTSIAYLLGRLFAVLERVQEEARKGTQIGTTIRDRFYGAASTNPVSVFPQLLKLKNHHIVKIENRGRQVNLEKEIGEIMEGIKEFPRHLTLDQQAVFAVGYYHQRQDFFKKKQH